MFSPHGEEARGRKITLDRYGHLMPGNEEEAAGLLDGYLAKASVASGIE